MGAFETSIAENLMVTTAERHVMANLNLDQNKWDAVSTHDDVRRIAQDIEVEAYCACCRIAKSVYSLAALGVQHDECKKVLATLELDAFEAKDKESKELERRFNFANEDLRTYLKQIFGTDNINPVTAIRYLEEAKKSLLRHALEMDEAMPGYESVKTSDGGRSVQSDTKGAGRVVHVDPEKIYIEWEDGNKEWVTQDAFAHEGIRLGDESGTAVEAVDGGTQGPSDSPDGTIGVADRERNPLMDYLQGYELEEEEQEGMKKAPSQSPKSKVPSKMTMSAAAGDVLLLPEKVKNEVKQMEGSIYRSNAPGSNAYRFSTDGNKIYRGEFTEESQGFGPYEWMYVYGTGEFRRNPEYKPSAFASVTSSVDYPDEKPGATKSNPQEPAQLNSTPKKIKYRLDALDEMTKTWKEVGTYDSLEKATDKECELKEKLPLTMETHITPLVGPDHIEKPDYPTTPKGPEGDNDKQTVKEVKAAEDVTGYSVTVDYAGDEPQKFTVGSEEYFMEDMEGSVPNLVMRAIPDFRLKELLAALEADDNVGDSITITNESTKKTVADDWQQARSLKDMQAESSQDRIAVAPKGWEGTVKKLKKHKDKVDNPWALAWWMKGEGYQPGGNKKSCLLYKAGAWELWLDGDEESPIVSQDPAVIAHLASKKMAWPLTKTARVLRYVKDLKRAYDIYGVDEGR